ncbi:SDR family oxidoreductase [Pararhizobium haloflavum]|uniref:SDR family oxidoreductase n=1 Tax=Pararhizobium haloflavum TaxID=2037914 RepID=UPI000C193C0C|nr:SDR family oxidoreductase [Pararhizobium haloflavum]
MIATARTLLVTGGSRGIGAAVSRLAGQRGYRVAVNYVTNRPAAEAVVADIQTAGGDAFAIAGDVGVERDVLAMFQAVDDRFGRLDALVNNAGVVDRMARLDEISADRLERMFRINITGAFLCAREAVKRMSTKHGGRGGAIVNLSSAAARLGSANWYVDYAASKGAIDTMTKGLALEVAAEGIRVNGVRPGIIDTDIHASGGEPGRVAAVRDSLPMKREGTAEEVARGILWLLSDEASYTTGTTLDITGGR